MTTTRPRSALLDFGLLLGRIAVGVTFVLHGWQKFDQNGLKGPVDMLTQLQVPYPQIAAWLLLALEVVGGLMLIFGVLVRPLGLLFAADMAGAIVLVHWSKGFFATDGGYELALVLGAVGLLFACTGGGRFGVDGIFARGRRERLEEKRQAAVAGSDDSTADTRIDQLGRV